MPTFPGGSWNQFPPPPPSSPPLAKKGLHGAKKGLPGAPRVPKVREECSIPGCHDEGIQSDFGSNYCKEHTRRYELFVMGILPSGGAAMTETMFAMFDYLMEEIDKLNTEVAMYRITKKYTGEESGNPGADSPDARHRYTRKSGKPSRRVKGI
jgi:hypothetical protein